MAKHPTTLIDIESYIQDDDSALSSQTKPFKITVFTPQKKYVLPSYKTTPLQKKPKTSPNTEDNTKNNKVNKYIEADNIQPKTHTKINITQIFMISILTIHWIIILPKRISKVQVTKKRF